MTPPKPTILIIGAGAVGLSLAGKLARVATVYAVCRKRHADVIRARGLRMEGVWGDQTVQDITCITVPDEPLPHADLIFVTAKGIDTRSICTTYAGMLRGRPVASIQNGIGNEEVIAGFTDHVIGGTITTNFSIAGAGHVKVRSQSAPMKLGIYPIGGSNEDTDEKTANALRRLLEILEDAGIPAEKSSSIRSDIWGKSLLNIAVNPIGALLGVPVGALQEAHLREIIGALIRETYAVTEKDGIRLPWKDADAYLTHLFSVQIPDFAAVFTSMHHDILNGRMTEIDLLNGYVAERGAELGIPTPYNRCITNLIHFRETMQESDKESSGAGLIPAD
jgi:2-dehydropantoate 2-reductase